MTQTIASSSAWKSTGEPLASAALLRPVPSDIDIAHSVQPLKITQIAQNIGLLEDEIIQYGPAAKIHANSVLERLADAPSAKYVVVAGMNPTSLGEGKTTTTLGITQALGAHLNKPVFATLRQPSQGPTFGVKGGAAGGGYSQILPMEDLNLHLTGDIHAVTAATNLCAAAIDTRMFHESTQSDDALFGRLLPLNDVMKKRCIKLGISAEKLENPAALFSAEEKRKFSRLDIDPDTIQVKRVLDVNDRFLREITIGQAATEQGRTRKTGFDISVASEVMAILALSNDLADMRRRMGSITVAYSRSGEPVTADDLGVAGAMTVLMKDTIQPTLMQSLERTPVIIHAGPFANIAHGNCGIIADRVALKLAGAEGFVLTEAGFGADIGGEKFMDIKCRASGLKPDAVVLVASVRAIKLHGGCSLAKTKEPNVEAVRAGVCNLVQHIENMRKFGVPVVVCINHFTADTEEETEIVRQAALAAGAFDAVPSTHWQDGGKGAVAVGEALIRCCASQKADFRLLYPTEGTSIKQKIETVAREIYRADGVTYSEEAEKKLSMFESHGLASLPVCIAKTQYSFTSDPEKLGAPRGFNITVRDVRAYTGAGLIVPLLGTIQTIPGLPTRPAYYDVDIDTNTGAVLGLS